MKIFVSTIILLTAGIFYTQAQNKELDGKTFYIKLKLIEGEKSAGSSWTEDELHFQGNNLIPKFMQQHEHFTPAPCEIKVDSASGEKMISFSAAHKNPGGSNIRWQGAVKGNHVEGSVVWVNANGTRMYSFTGTLKEP